MSATFTDYQKAETKKALERDLDLHESLLKAWQKVTRIYKKNGEPFANLGKNFEGAKFYDENYTLIKGKELTVTTQTAKNGYQSEAIRDYELAKYTKFNPDESRIIKESFLEPYFYLTADEMEKKIKEKIEYHETRVVELTKALTENDKDNETAAQILKTITEMLATVNPDAARIYREKLIRNYY